MCGPHDMEKQYNDKYTKYTNTSKNTKYGLCKLYKIQNQSLKIWDCFELVCKVGLFEMLLLCMYFVQ